MQKSSNQVVEPRFSWPRSHCICISSGSFHPSEPFPDPFNKTIPYFVNRSFWRLIAYIMNPSNLSKGRTKPSLFLLGPPSCGKSYTIAAVSGFFRQKRLVPKYQVIVIGDITAWPGQKLSDIIAFFALEFLHSIRKFQDVQLQCLRNTIPFTLSELESWLSSYYSWLQKNDTTIVLFVDQVCADVNLNDHPVFSILKKVIDKFRERIIPIISITQYMGDDHIGSLNSFANDLNCKNFEVMEFPFNLYSSEISKFLECWADQFRKDDNQKTDKIMASLASFNSPQTTASISKDIIMHVGYNICEIVGFFRFSSQNNGKNAYSVLDTYSSMHSESLLKSLNSCSSEFDSKTLSNLLCRVILRLPIGLTFPTSSLNLSQQQIKKLPLFIRKLFIPRAVQRFYHSKDFSEVICGVPTFNNLICYSSLFKKFDLWGKIINPEGTTLDNLLDKHLCNVMHSKVICAESKRQVFRFYFQSALCRVKSSNSLSISLLGEYGRSTEIVVDKDNTVAFFAGLVPSKELLAWIYLHSVEKGEKEPKDADTRTIILIPGRSDYCFFDAFVIPKGHRRLYAISTLPSAPQWSIASTTNNEVAGKSYVNPSGLLEMWSRVFRELGAIKLSIQSVYLSPETFIQKHIACPY